jgi:repressor LexA
MQELTERQRAILDFIARHITEKRFPPTIREIGEGMGIRSTNGVNDHLKALERKGFLTRGELKSRALVPTDKAWELLGGKPLAASPAANDDLAEVPLIGRVAAGAPILAEENRDTVLRVDPALLGPAGSRDGVFVAGSACAPGPRCSSCLRASRRTVAACGSRSWCCWPCDVWSCCCWAGPSHATRVAMH